MLGINARVTLSPKSLDPKQACVTLGFKSPNPIHACVACIFTLAHHLPSCINKQIQHMYGPVYFLFAHFHVFMVLQTFSTNQPNVFLFRFLGTSSFDLRQIFGKLWLFVSKFLRCMRVFRNLLDDQNHEIVGYLGFWYVPSGGTWLTLAPL